jgi:acyl dehydratase
MRMMVDNMARDGHAGLGSPGLDELRWLKPVYPGDTLRVESALDDVRPSRSKPDMGSVHSTVTVFNQHDEPVMRMKSIGLVRRRPGGDQ